MLYRNEVDHEREYMSNSQRGPTQEEKWWKGMAWLLIKGATSPDCMAKLHSCHTCWRSSKWKLIFLSVIDAIHISDGLYLRLNGGGGRMVLMWMAAMTPAISLLTNNLAEAFDPQRPQKHRRKHKSSHWMKFLNIAHFIEFKKLSITICNLYKEEGQTMETENLTDNTHTYTESPNCSILTKSKWKPTMWRDRRETSLS